MKSLKFYLPGAPDAIGRGCKCPISDNSNGKGWMGIPDLFVIAKNCPLHDKGARKINKNLTKK